MVQCFEDVGPHAHPYRASVELLRAMIVRLVTLGCQLHLHLPCQHRYSCNRMKSGGIALASEEFMHYLTVAIVNKFNNDNCAANRNVYFVFVYT